MNGSTNQVRGEADVHRCPPVPSTGPFGGLIPHAVRHDRWCWAPDHGFHPRTAPHQRVPLRPAAGMLTRGHTISVRRAVTLGAQRGHADLAHAFSELDSWVPFTDADVFARLGHALRHLSPPDVDDPRQREVVVRALSLLDQSRLPRSWQRPLAAASTAPVHPDELARLRDA